MIGPEKFRRVMGQFATGVTVVTVRDAQGEPSGLTVNALTSVSLDPPLLLICIHHDAETLPHLLEAGVFAINVLSREQEALAMVFSQGAASQRFRGLDTDPGPLGSPLLPGSVAWMECRVKTTYPGGDHTIVLAELVESEIVGGDPLLFVRGVLTGPETSPEV